MNVKEIMKMNAIDIYDISALGTQAFNQNEWALLHLDNDGIIKGLHYKSDDDDEFEYLHYIAGKDIEKTDTIHHGFIENHIFYVTEVKYKGKE